MMFQFACYRSPEVTCGEGVHLEGNTCLPDGFNLEDICGNGAHVVGDFCVGDDVVIPPQNECGQCTYLFVDESIDLRECRLDPVCEPIPPGPANCGTGTEWDDETQMCQLIPTNPCGPGTFQDQVTGDCLPDFNSVVISCKTNNYCETQGCTSPEPWIYSSSQSAPMCDCGDNLDIPSNPICCGKGEFIDDDKGTACLTAHFNPYLPWIKLSCWTRMEIPEGCEDPGRWDYDLDQLPYLICEGGNQVIERALCCPVDIHIGACITEGFDPYHHPVIPECRNDEECMDDNACTLGFCEDGYCDQFEIKDNRSCEGETPFSILDDCVCWTGKPTRYECQDANESCTAHTTTDGQCESPESWLYDGTENIPVCLCPDFSTDHFASPYCTHKDYETGQMMDPMHNPYEHCLYSFECQNTDPDNPCVETVCQEGRCIMKNLPNGFPLHDDWDVCRDGHEVGVECFVPSDCGEHPCATEVCSLSGMCHAFPYPNGEPCDNDQEDCFCLDGIPEILDLNFNVSLNENSPSGNMNDGEIVHDYHVFLTFDLSISTEGTPQPIHTYIKTLEFKIESDCLMDEAQITTLTYPVHNLGHAVYNVETDTYVVQLGYFPDFPWYDDPIYYRDTIFKLNWNEPQTFSFGAYESCQDGQTIRASLVKVTDINDNVVYGVDEGEYLEGHELYYIHDGSCLYEIDCYDNNACTDQYCSNQTCVYGSRSDGEPCFIPELPEDQQMLDCYCRDVEGSILPVTEEVTVIDHYPPSTALLSGEQEVLSFTISYTHPIDEELRIGAFDFEIMSTCLLSSARLEVDQYGLVGLYPNLTPNERNLFHIPVSSSYHPEETIFLQSNQQVTLNLHVTKDCPEIGNYLQAHLFVITTPENEDILLPELGEHSIVSGYYFHR